MSHQAFHGFKKRQFARVVRSGVQENALTKTPAGEESFSAQQAKVILTEAARDLGRVNSNRQATFESTFAAVLTEVTAANKTVLNRAFAEAFLDNIYNTLNSRAGAAQDISGPLLALAHAAGLDQSVTDGFALVKDSGND